VRRVIGSRNGGNYPSVLWLYYVWVQSVPQKLTKMTAKVRQRLRGLTKGFGMGGLGREWLTWAGGSVCERLMGLRCGEGGVRWGCIGYGYVEGLWSGDVEQLGLSYIVIRCSNSLNSQSIR
jgi:hypothetical protein